MAQEVIEGIGNEVFISLFCLIPALVTFIYVKYQYFTSNESSATPSIDRINTSVQSHAENQQRRSRHHPGENITCPLCLDTSRFVVETNCGHVFCGLCLKQLWTHTGHLRSLSCPCCRQRINILFPLFTREESLETSTDKETVVNFAYDYNRRFSGEPRSLIEHLRDLPVLLRHLFEEFTSPSGLLICFRIRIIICFFSALIYLLSPLDIIPEAIFGIFGIIDDIFIILVILAYCANLYRNYASVEGLRNAFDTILNHSNTILNSGDNI